MSVWSRVSVADLAATGEVPERTLYRWIAEGRLTVVYRSVGGGRRVAMVDPLEVAEVAERLGRVDGRP